MILRQIRWLLAVGYVVFLAWLVHCANNSQHHLMPNWVSTILHAPYGDKIGHFFFVGFLAFMANWVLDCRSLRILGWNVLVGSAMCFFAAACEETSQAFNPFRAFDLVDLGMNTLGVLLIGRLAVFLQFARFPIPRGVQPVRWTR